MLTATMSHEMLTPLNSIINLAFFVEKNLQKMINPFNDRETEAQISQSIEYVTMIKSSGLILQYIVNDLKDLMEIKQGKFKQAVKTLNFKTLTVAC